MTREQLYNLVWSKPMTHLAKEFGISDVALRKHCKKLDIPTPYVGYWVKLAHGRRARKSPLSTRKHAADELVYLSQKVRSEESAECLQASEAARAELAQLRSELAVPERLPGRSHPLIQVTRERLQRTKPNNQGLLIIGNAYNPSISVGLASIQRVLRILFTLRKVAHMKGQELYEENGHFYWWVKEERFVLRLHETTDKTPHQPTSAEIREQTHRDQRRKEHPDWYTSDRKVHRTWDYSPSGRLTIELSDSERYRWGAERVQHRWRDTKGRALELCLAELFIWLASAEIKVREQRLKYEEICRIQAAEEEQRRILEERREKAKKLEQFILQLAKIQKTTKHVSELLNAMIVEDQKTTSWPMDRLFKEVHCYQMHLKSMSDEGAVFAFLTSLKLNQDDPLIVPYLAKAQKDNVEQYSCDEE